jgi:hypothetical protein
MKLKNNFIPKKRTFYSDKFILQHYVANKYMHINNKYTNDNNAMLMLPYFTESKKLLNKNGVKMLNLLYYSIKEWIIKNFYRKSKILAI